MAKTVLIVEDNELNMKLFHDLLGALLPYRRPAPFEAPPRAQARSRPDQHGYPVPKYPVEVPNGSRTSESNHSVVGERRSHEGDEERLREGGCEAYLSNPILVGKFIETVRHFLGPEQRHDRAHLLSTHSGEREVLVAAHAEFPCRDREFRAEAWRL